MLESTHSRLKLWQTWKDCQRASKLGRIAKGLANFKVFQRSSGPACLLPSVSGLMTCSSHGISKRRQIITQHRMNIDFFFDDFSGS